MASRVRGSQLRWHLGLDNLGSRDLFLCTGGFVASFIQGHPQPHTHQTGTTKNVSKHCPRSPGGAQNCPQLRVTQAEACPLPRKTAAWISTGEGVEVEGLGEGKTGTTTEINWSYEASRTISNLSGVLQDALRLSARQQEGVFEGPTSFQ